MRYIEYFALVHRVKNEHGPQVRRNYTDALDKLMTNVPSTKAESDTKTMVLNEGLRERLDDAENALGLKPIPSNIYARLKAIEQRIGYLETVSPEYRHFVVSFYINTVHARRC